MFLMPLSQCHWRTLQSHLHHSLLRVSDTSILIGKKFMPLCQFRRIPPFQWKVLNHQRLPLTLMSLLSSAKVNGPALIILSPILFFMIVLILFLLVCPVFVFYIYTQVIWGCYIGTCLKTSYGWRNEWSCFSTNLGVRFCTHGCCYCGLSLGLHFEVSPR